MSHPPILIVDENDQPIGESNAIEAWRKGMRHRIVRIMLEDKDGRVLLQLRSSNSRVYPNCWDHSAAGHVDAGEDYETAAKRELEEEIGVRDVSLEKIDTYYTDYQYKDFVLRRFNTLYRAEINQTPKDLQPEEVSEVRWFTKDELRALVRDRPDKITDGLRDVINKLYS